MLERRGFLGAMLGAGAASWLADPPEAVAAPRGSASEEWDFSWLDKLNGKHKQVFDYREPAGGLLVIKNWLEGHETLFGLKPPQVNAVVGIATPTFPVNASDELWRKFPIGELWKLNDPDTGAPAVRNIFMDGGKVAPFIGAGVRPLMERGAIFWQCNNALQRVASRIAGAVKRPEAEIYQECRAGLNPGVIVIPAHTVLLGMCQERGCAYEVL